jgi:hypothetical protein
MREAQYQRYLIERIEGMFPGCLILKNDSSYIQGIPDLLVLWGRCWAMLEVKPSGRSRSSPNQDYYIRVLDEFSFASFIYPENEEEVLRELQFAFAP